jgi:pimeloyl-ACP methyl ester carboxylesterase
VPAFRFYPFMIGAAHGAQLFVVEHRYYGESQPYDDWSLDNLVHLSSEQALADLAVFLNANNAGPDRKTMVIGGSYPGALSAWFRVHYP